MGDHQKRFSVGAVFFFDEQKPFGRDVVWGGIHILNKLHGKRIRDVVNHQSARPLQPDEGVGAAESLSQDDAFRFGAFVVAARVESRRCAVGIESRRKLRGGDPFEIVTAIKNQIPISRSCW